MTNWSHAGARLTSPWRQGDLDALCGLYAVINALRILHAPVEALSLKVCKRLFRDGLDAACKKHSGITPVFDGMTLSRQMKVAKAVFKSRGLHNHPPAILRKPLEQVAHNVDLDRRWEGCRKRGEVLLACFEGKISHHTVIYGLNDDRIFLFDSACMRFVFRRTLRLAETPNGKLILKSLVPMGLQKRDFGVRKRADAARTTTNPKLGHFE